MSRPRPVPSPTTEAFWAATADEQLLIQRCAACGHTQLYPRATCTSCGSSDLGWMPASGRATLHTFTVARRATHPAFDGAEPYVVAIVELAEGPRVTGNVVDCPVDDVRVGMALELAWDEPGEDGIRLPLWRPA
jgi:uncharacterized OB-fold protein